MGKKASSSSSSTTYYNWRSQLCAAAALLCLGLALSPHALAATDAADAADATNASAVTEPSAREKEQVAAKVMARQEAMQQVLAQGSKCVSNAPDDYKGKVWQIGTDNAFAPFAFVDAQGGLKGIDVDLLAKIAENAGFKYRMCSQDFAPLLPAVAAGKLDGAMAGISYTVPRAQTLEFSKRYYNSAVAVVAAKSEQSQLTSIQQVIGKTVAVKAGTLGEDIANGLKEARQFTVKSYPNSMASMLAVFQGEADFLLEDYPVAVYELTSGLYSNLMIVIPRLPNVGNSESYHFVVAKDNKESQQLLQAFNTGLEKVIVNGDYKAVVAKYLPEAPASVFVSGNAPVEVKATAAEKEAADIQ